MKHNVKAPSVGESVTEVSILKWAKQNGQQVKSGDLLMEIESDKATVEIFAEATGALTILKPAGERIPVGELVGTIDDSITGTAGASTTVVPPPPAAARPTPPPLPTASPAAAAGATAGIPTPGPAARKMAADQGVDLAQVSGTGKDGRVTKGDIAAYQAGGAQTAAPVAAPAPADRPGDRRVTQADREGDRRIPMTMLRQRIAERLVQAQHTAAILTTFNEVDMTAVNELRTKYKDGYKAKGLPMSFVTFFAKASIAALKAIPEVNGSIDGRDMIYHDYYDIGVAVGTDRGLVVPVIRDAHKMSFAELDRAIVQMGERAKTGKLSIAELSGGTFTISNGGTYGSLLSTPILNPPQSGILGMHKIQERPMAMNGQVVIRPMMYLALSYDHRLIDGKGAVTFLVTLKDHLEHPEKLGLEF